MKKIAAAHTAVFDENGRILMALGRDIPLWIFPGGQIEEGETPEVAAKRELMEEVGVEGHDFELVAEYEFPDRIRRFYRAKASNEGKLSVQKHEIREARWFAPNELPAEKRDYDTQKTQDLLNFDGTVIRRKIDHEPNEELLGLFRRIPFWMVFVMFCYLKWKFRTNILRRK